MCVCCWSLSPVVEDPGKIKLRITKTHHCRRGHLARMALRVVLMKVKLQPIIAGHLLKGLKDGNLTSLTSY